MWTKVTLVITTLATVAVGYIVSHPLVFNVCSNKYEFNNYTGCLDSTVKSVGSPLLLFSLGLLLPVVLAVFFQKKIFFAWFKFAAWAVPLLALLIIITPTNNPGALFVFYPFYRDDAARLAGGIFTAASLILIVWKYFTYRKQPAL